jgi:hypothetical protein
VELPEEAREHRGGGERNTADHCYATPPAQTFPSGGVRACRWFKRALRVGVHAPSVDRRPIGDRAGLR